MSPANCLTFVHSAIGIEGWFAFINRDQNKSLTLNCDYVRFRSLLPKAGPYIVYGRQDTIVLYLQYTSPQAISKTFARSVLNQPALHFRCSNPAMLCWVKDHVCVQRQGFRIQRRRKKRGDTRQIQKMGNSGLCSIVHNLPRFVTTSQVQMESD